MICCLVHTTPMGTGGSCKFCGSKRELMVSAAPDFPYHGPDGNNENFSLPCLLERSSFHLRVFWEFQLAFVGSFGACWVDVSDNHGSATLDTWRFNYRAVCAALSISCHVSGFVVCRLSRECG